MRPDHPLLVPRRRRLHSSWIAAAAAITAAALAHGCAATPPATSGAGGASSVSSGATTGSGGHRTTSSASSNGSGGGGGVFINLPEAGDAKEEPIVDPCHSACGPVELCDPEHLGLDDDCNGLVDETCGCSAGTAHFCFRGDPAEHANPAHPTCQDGTEVCNEQGQWGPCIGGFHAWPPDNCTLDDMSNCHPITSAPFADVSLKTGTGAFSANATPGSETWAVACPAGVNPCPAVTAPDVYKPLQSGEYTVTYTKLVAGDPTPKTCSFPLIVGAPGLRVELSWEHTAADQGVDLDLHVHKPNDTLPWGVHPGVPQDCTWNDCTFNDFIFGGPSWFADPPAMPPTPVNWYLDPVFSKNTCFFAPQGIGLQWQFLGKGCHNPRLDLDNITCDFTVTDPNDSSFCAPENINIDFPPDDQWTRIGVHYYWNHDQTYDVHPRVKVFCAGALAADLGPAGFYDPETPVTFTPADGTGQGDGNRFWIVADVAFKTDSCQQRSCIVKPVYSDPAGKTPFLVLDNAATSVFAPSYPPPP